MRPIDVVRKACPSARKSYLAAFENGEDLFAKAQINTPLRLAHFLAQVCHETGGLTIEWESGAYTADRLIQIFGVGHHSANVTRAEAVQLAKNGPAIFERVYGLGNKHKADELGNTQPGDGWKYRGGGLMQTTGRANYRRMGLKTGVDFERQPELVLSAEHALKPALAEWTEGKLNAKADPSEKFPSGDIEAITRRINGGTNGLADRKAWFAKIRPIIDGVTLASTAVTSQGDPEVAAVQRRLDAMGYPPGVQDGKWGGMTAGAIAGFKNDRGLAGEPIIDDALKVELTKAESGGFKRPIAKARAEATTETVAKSAPEIIPVQQTKKLGIWATITSLVLAAINAVADYFQDAMTWVGTIKSSAGDLPAYVWLIVAALVTMAMAYAARNGAKGIIEAFRKGERA